MLSTVTRRGRWSLPRTMRVAAFLGHVNLDLTQVSLSPGESTIEVLCILGEVAILVPQSLRVDCTGSPVFGEFHLEATSDTPPSATAPLVRISGSAIGGKVSVRVVDPSAPGWWEAWLLRRRKPRKDRERKKRA